MVQLAGLKSGALCTLPRTNAESEGNNRELQLQQRQRGWHSGSGGMSMRSMATI